jgi:hypothetical protein
MTQWQFRATMAVCFLLSLLPFALCLPLWKYVHRETLVAWRRVLSKIGLGLATVASVVPPLWLFTMQLLSRTKDSNESPMLGLMIDAVLVGMGAHSLPQSRCVLRRAECGGGGLLPAR